ncbi:hypothetical protein D5S17_09285 [Pseudonocardiaceae bacterium YIM PH 21723]|nr:hypothetical protein D5S17_09285 [Pseudonocardiaceae bacterium YIM PH 21723]
MITMPFYEVRIVQEEIFRVTVEADHQDHAIEVAGSAVAEHPSLYFADYGDGSTTVTQVPEPVSPDQIAEVIRAEKSFLDVTDHDEEHSLCG